VSPLDPPAIHGYDVIGPIEGEDNAFLARQTRMDRQVILKTAPSSDPRAAAELRREAAAAAKVGNEAAAGVIDAGTMPSGDTYLVVELIEGERLATLLRASGGLPWRLAATHAAAFAKLLAALAKAGVRPSRLNPSVIALAPDGAMRVADPRCLLPSRETSVDREDVVAIGKILRGLLGGRVPPAPLGQILAKIEAGTYTTAASVAADLAPAAHTPERSHAVARRFSRSSTSTALGAAFATVVVLVLVWMVLVRPALRPAPSPAAPSAAKTPAATPKTPAVPVETPTESPTESRSAASLAAFETFKKGITALVSAGSLGEAEAKTLVWMGTQLPGEGMRAADAFIRELERLSERDARAAQDKAEALAEAGRIEEALAALEAVASRATRRDAGDLRAAAAAIAGRLDGSLVDKAVTASFGALIAGALDEGAKAIEPLAAKAHGVAAKTRIEAIAADIQAAQSAQAAAGADATEDALAKAAADPNAPAPLRRGISLILAARGDAWKAGEILGEDVGAREGISIPDLWAAGAARGIEAGLARAEAALGEGRREPAEAAVADVVRRFRYAQTYDAARARIEGLLARLVGTTATSTTTIEALLHPARKSTKDGVLTVRYEFESSAEAADFRAAPGSAARIELGGLTVTGRAVLLGSGSVPPALFRSPISIRGRALIATADDPGFGIVWGGSAGETLARVGRPAGTARELARCSIFSSVQAERREIATRPAPALVPFDPFEFEIQISGDTATFTVAKVMIEAKGIAGGAEGGIAIDTGGRTIFLDEIEITGTPNPQSGGAETSSKAVERLQALELEAPALPWAGI